MTKKQLKNKRKVLLYFVPVFLILTVIGVLVFHWSENQVKYDGKNMYGSSNPESDFKPIDNSDEYQYFGSPELEKQDKDDTLEKKGVDDTTKSKEEISLSDIFPILITEPLSEEDKKQAHENTMQSEEMATYVNKLENNVERYMDGTFAWNYQSKDNLKDFLAFRGGSYFFHEQELGAKELYEEIHQTVEDGMLMIDYDFEQDKAGVFIHPTRGGYVISGNVKIRYHSENDTRITGIEPDKWFEFPYEVEFNFKTIEKTDEWLFWDDESALLLKGNEYTYE